MASRSHKTYQDNYFLNNRSQTLIIQAIYYQMQTELTKFYRKNEDNLYDLEIKQVLNKCAEKNNIFSEYLDLYEILEGPLEFFKLKGKPQTINKSLKKM